MHQLQQYNSICVNSNIHFYNMILYVNKNCIMYILMYEYTIYVGILDAN